MQEDLTTQIQDTALSAIKQYNKGAAFIARKLTDMPTDALQVVPRKYVTLNGSTALRPKSSVVGQFYLDTSMNLPLWWNGTGWIDATGSYH